MTQPHVLIGTGRTEALVHLGAVVTGETQQARDGIRVFPNVGLAGTEAWLVDTLLHSRNLARGAWVGGLRNNGRRRR